MLSFRNRLHQHGVLGMNSRNSDYIMRYNSRRLYPLVDDKQRTKNLAIKAGMAVPPLYGVIESQHGIRHLDNLIEGHNQFVIKPAHGSGGDGILVIAGRLNGRFRKVSGQLMDRETIEYHISSTLSGQYSLGGRPDKVMIEYCVQGDPLFKAVSFQGIPDIRIITFRGFPVMAMARLPTRESNGKANLHQGAIGVGIDLASGVTLEGVRNNDPVLMHPDTGNPVSGITIPDWLEILKLAARCYELSGLGYLGVDVVLDRQLGPLILELNARPGLNIQIANRHGLSERLSLIKNKLPKTATPAERVRFMRYHFRQVA